MADDERRARGRAKMSEIARIPEIEPTDAFMAFTTDQVFGELWQRPGLPDRDRRLVTIAILGAHALEPELRIHVRAALESGDVTPAEIMELVLHVAHYAGFPLGATIHRAVRSACEELGLELPEA